MPPPAGAGRLLILAGEIGFADRRRGCARSVASDSRSACSASPASRAKRLAAERRLDVVASRRPPRSPGTTAPPSLPASSTWPTRSSSCSRCMTMTIDALRLVVEARIERAVEPLRWRRRGGSRTSRRRASADRRSMMTSAPRPVSTPPTEVASRNPPAVVISSRQRPRGPRRAASETTRDTRTTP